VTNADFTKALGRALGRPAVVPVPGVALKLMFGEMAEILTMSDRMVPMRLLDEGFRFRYPDLAAALAAMFAQR
jgi:NAD dependent epimerase/dehydratase family enzyme